MLFLQKKVASPDPDPTAQGWGKDDKQVDRGIKQNHMTDVKQETLRLLPIFPAK